MPRKPRVRPPSIDDLPPEETDYIEPQVEGSISRLLSQFGDGEIIVKVYEQNPNGEERFLYVIPQPTPEKISEETVRATNRGKGGKFVLRFIVDGELRTTQTLMIADDPTLNTVQGVQASSGDPMMQILLQKLTFLEGQLASRQHVEREPINDLADAMLKLQQLQAPKQETSIDTILKCIEIGKSLGGNGGGSEWGSILKDIVKEVGPVIAPLVMAGMNGGAPGAPGAAQLPAGQEGQNGMMEEQLLRQGIAYLKKKCMMRSDPGLYVDMIIDNADEFPYSKLVHLSTAQEFSAFVALDPEIGNEPFRTFFEFVYNGLRSHFSKSDPVDNNSAGTGGDTGDAASHGGTGTAGSG